MIHKTTIEPPRLYAEETDPLAEAFLGNFALISCAIKLLLYETGGGAALYGVGHAPNRQEDHRCPANTFVRCE